MANKLLILGAAMAHKNKSYNLSGSITKAVDKSLAQFTKMIQARQQSIARTSLRTQGYLDKLPENPEIELLPDPIKKVYFGELSKVRQNIANLNNERFDESKAALYMPGTDAYNDMMTNIAKEEKRLKTLLGYATKFQQVNADWFREHGNISETWKTMNPDLYEAMSNILNTENPDYTVSFDDKGELVFETQIDEVNDPLSNLTEDDDPSTAPTTSSKSVKFGLDELDWAQFSNTETVKINELFESAVNDGLQGKNLNAVSINNSRMLINSLIGDDESKIFSLALDSLPMGNNLAPMPLFTDQEFETMFPDFDENDPNTYPDVSKIKTAVVEKLVGKIKEANTNAMPKVQGYFNDANVSSTERNRRTVFARNTARLVNLLNSVKEGSIEEIVEAIAKKSHLAASINSFKNDGSSILPDENSIGLSVTKSFNIKELVQNFKNNPDTNLQPLVERLLLELSPSSKGRSAVYNDLFEFSQLAEDDQLRQINQSGGLRPGN